jgi:hypothetical protein
MEFVAWPGGWFCACAVVSVLLSINMRRKMGEKPKLPKKLKTKKNCSQKMLLLALLGGRCYPQNKLRPMAMVSVTPVPQCQGRVGCVKKASFFINPGCLNFRGLVGLTEDTCSTRTPQPFR